jgi:hypothetical protein
MNYYSGKLLFFEVLINFTYVISFILTPLVIALHDGPMQSLRLIEQVVDLLVLLSILIGILKPRKVKDDILDSI